MTAGPHPVLSRVRREVAEAKAWPLVLPQDECEVVRRVLSSIALAVRQSCACASCKEFIAELIRDTLNPGSDEQEASGGR